MQTWAGRGFVVLAALCALPAWGQAERVVETTFTSLETIPGSDMRILHTGDRQTYQVRPEVYKEHEAFFYTTKRGDPIRIEVGSGSVLVSIAKSRGGSAGPDDAPPAGGDAEGHRQRLQALTRGDIVEINGAVFRFLAAADAYVTLSPRVPGSNPPRYSGSSRLDYEAIQYLNVLEAKQPEEQPQDTGNVSDLLSREGVAPGDTVIVRMQPGSGPGAVRGRVVGMSREVIRVAAWRGAGYDRLIDLPRPDVRAVERVAMEGRRNVPLGSLTIAWSETRYVERRAGRSEFQVVLQHDDPGNVLVGLWLRPLSPTGQPLATGGAAVRPMFPGMPRAVDLTAGDMEASLGLSQEGLSTIDSGGPEAEQLLIEAIDGARDDQTLRALLLATTQSGNPRLLSYAACRAVLEPADSSGARLAREALAKVSEQVASWIDSALALEDDQLRVTAIDNLQLQTLGLPSGVRPLDFRGRLIGLYGALDRVLTRERAGRLFEFALRDGSLVAPLAAAFAGSPATVLPLLVDTALDGELTQDRRQLAGDAIAAMGPAGIDALSAELVGRGIDARPLAQAVEAGRSLPDQVEVGLRLARLQRVEGTVQEARALLGKGEFEQAHALLHPVLVQFPTHAAARKVLEDLRLPLARLYLSTRRRSGAMRLLAEAEGQEAKARLAALYIEAANEELTGVVVRDEPHVAAQNIGLLDRGQSLPGRRVDEDWVEVSFSADRKGYVRSVCLDNAGDTFTVRVIYLPVPAFEDLLEHAKELAPELAPQCDNLLGRRYLQEAVQSHEDGDYGRALTLFAKARERIDEDERFSLERIAWFHANAWLFAGLGGLLVISIAVYFLANWLRRRRKIELSKDAPLEITTQSGRVVKPTARQAAAPARESWASPIFLLKVVLAAGLGGVILFQAYKLWRAF